MGNGIWAIDDNLPLVVATHTPSTSAAVDADSAPTYRVYEQETTTPILTGTMALLDDANTTGVYSEVIALTAANGFEAGKGYTIVVSGTVGGVTGNEVISFQVAALSTLTDAEVWAYATRLLTGNVNNVTIVSAVSGANITAYTYATWGGTITDSSLALTDYENLILVVKNEVTDADNDAILLVDITTGLIRIGGAAPTAANLGTVVKNSATSFTFLIAMSEVVSKITSANQGTYPWQLKGVDTTDNPDEGYVLIEGNFIIKGGAARQIL